MVNNNDSEIEVELINQHSQVISEISLCSSFSPLSDIDPRYKTISWFGTLGKHGNCSKVLVIGLEFFLLRGRSALIIIIIFFLNICNFSEIWGLLHVGGFL